MNSLGFRVLFALAAIAVLAPARPASTPGCGAHLNRSDEELYLHRQAERHRGLGRSARARTLAAAIAANRDFGNIAAIDDSDGAVAQQNAFNLNQKTVAFIPSAPLARKYRIETTGPSYDSALAESGSPLEALGDDGARQVFLPFAFPYFGVSYRDLWVNSDGNLTFSRGDAGSTDRSLGAFTGGPPRISPLFTDLDPSSAQLSGGVRFLAEPGRAVISWRSVPLYSNAGAGVQQTFQVRLFPDGRIEFAFDTVLLSDGAVTGISPGAAQSFVSLIPLISGSAAEFAGPVADRFSNSPSVDIAIVAQKFYATHGDAYDYLVIYNAVGVQAAPQVVAYEVTVRNHRSGYGDRPVESGAEFGSPRRLQAVLNMGPLYQYPADPYARVPLRGATGDTTVSVLGHEAGHLFLAFASVEDPGNPRGKPMLGRALVHWSFDFNSDASLLEGNRIQDLGESASPRFLNTATVQGYSPLDQYLMGFRAAAEVPPTFLVAGSPYAAATAPQAGVSFDGIRRDITVDDVIASTGRRTPDYTVAQRRFRFAFILITPTGQPSQPVQIAQLEAYRAAFEDFYKSATSNRAIADTSLKRAVQLSAFPALGVAAGGEGTATLTLDSPADRALTFQLASEDGVQVPPSVTIAAGAAQAVFKIQGLREGVAELTAAPMDGSYETTAARVQVTAPPSGLSLELLTAARVSGSPGVELAPIQVRVVDINQVPFAGVKVVAATTTGSLDSSAALTDANGIASFRWTPVSNAGSVQARVEGGAGLEVVFAGQPAMAVNGIVNAASFVPGITPGSLASIFGAGLSGGVTASPVQPLPFGVAGVQVLVNGTPARIAFVSDSQINLVVPPGVTGLSASIEIDNPAGHFTGYAATVNSVSPGIFSGGIRRAGAAIEIYATGLGVEIPPVQVLIGNVPATVLAAVASAQFPGIYQINAAIAPGTPSGDPPVVIVANGIRSNEVQVHID